MTLVSPLVLGLEHQKQLDQLVKAGSQELVDLYSVAKASGDWNAFADTLRAGFPIIYARYTQMSDLLSTAFYTLLRENAVSGSDINPQAYTPGQVYDPELSNTKAQSATGYALSLASRGFADTNVKKAFAGALNEGVYEQSFESIVANIDSDDFAAEYKRIPSANACAFCLEVGAALGEGFEEGFDKKFHANCKCVVVATFSNQGDLDIRRSNLKKYEADREKARELIISGEYKGVERVVPRDSQEYTKMAERRLSTGITAHLKDEGLKGRELRVQAEDLKSNVMPEVISRLKSKTLTPEDINLLDQWGTAYDLYDNGSETYPAYKTEVSRVSRKDLMFVLRDRFGYK